MTSQEPFSFGNKQKPTEEQVPHSNIHHDEKPLREFDKTPLDKAPLDFDPRIHEGELSTQQLPENFQPSPQKKEKFLSKTRNKVGLGLAALGLAGGAVAGYNAFSDEDKEAEPRQPSVSAPANPGEGTPDNPVENETITLDVEDFGQNGELFADAYYDMQNEWTNSGITPETANSEDRFTMSDEEYAATINAPIDEEYLSKYFVSDWQSNPNLAEYIDSMISIHQTNSHLALITANPENGDLEPYRRETNLESSEIVSQQDGELVINTRWTESDNQDQNRAGEYINGTDPNTQSGGITITSIETEDGRKISDIAYYAG